MKGLTFFLGSSSSGFKAINGYYSKAILYTNKGSFVTNAAGAQKVQNARGDPHSFNPAKLVEKVADKTKKLATLKCGKTVNPSKLTKDYGTTYAFAENYAVWGWTKATSGCKKQELFRLVIDTPSEVKGFKYDADAVGNNVFVGTFEGGNLKITSYTIGI